MIITIDGPVATGKSTIAKRLANSLGFIFFDTGAMYRAITYGIIEEKIDLTNDEHLSAFLSRFTFDMKVMHGTKRYYIEQEDVTEKIRTEDVTNLVSKVSALKVVRDKLVAIQRKMAVGVNAVFEGRDMGTVVFPDAKIKVFLTGRSEVRAKRRYEEIIAGNPELAKTLTKEKVLEDLTKRDQYDSTREISPLKQAEDAYLIDTSDLSVDEIVFKILEYKDTLRSSANR